MSRLRRIVFFALLVCNLGIISFHNTAVAQRYEQAQGTREIISRAEPVYPEIAHRVRLKGSVRLQVKVAADGSVSSIRVLGGNPIFVKAGVEATQKWRWERASGNTEEIVQLTFRSP